MNNNRNNNKKMMIKWCKINPWRKIRLTLQRKRKILWGTFRKNKTLMMMTLRMRIFHPFLDRCLSSETIQKLKDKKVKEVDWWNYPTEDPEKIKSLTKPLNWFVDKKKKEKENSILKSKLKHNKKPLSIKFSTKLEENSSKEKRNKTNKKRKRSKKHLKLLEKFLRLSWLIITKEIWLFSTILNFSQSLWRKHPN